jgi:hypothetical protein
MYYIIIVFVVLLPVAIIVAVFPQRFISWGGKLYSKVRKALPDVIFREGERYYEEVHQRTKRVIDFTNYSAAIWLVRIGAIIIAVIITFFLFLMLGGYYIIFR